MSAQNCDALHLAIARKHNNQAYIACVEIILNARVERSTSSNISVDLSQFMINTPPPPLKSSPLSTHPIDTSSTTTLLPPTNTSLLHTNLTTQSSSETLNSHNVSHVSSTDFHTTPRGSVDDVTGDVRYEEIERDVIVLFEQVSTHTDTLDIDKGDVESERQQRVSIDIGDSDNEEMVMDNPPPYESVMALDAEKERNGKRVLSPVRGSNRMKNIRMSDEGE